MNYRLSDEQFKKWINNILRFTAPALIVLFYQLSQGVDIKAAYPLALYSLYGLIADYLRKLE